MKKRLFLATAMALALPTVDAASTFDFVAEADGTMNVVSQRGTVIERELCRR